MRTKSQVEEAQASVHGCCSQHADYKSCNCLEEALPDPLTGHIDRCVQLHQQIRIIYVVDGYLAYYEIYDGNKTERAARGDTIQEALTNLEKSLALKPPKQGGPSTL